MCFDNLLVLGIILLAKSGYPTGRRVTLVQHHACQMVPAEKKMICQCREEDTMAYMGLRMMGFEGKIRQEVRFKFNLF